MGNEELVKELAISREVSLRILRHQLVELSELFAKTDDIQEKLAISSEIKRMAEIILVSVR